MAIIAFSIDWVVKNLTSLELGTSVTVVLALVLGEASKYLNNK